MRVSDRVLNDLASRLDHTLRSFQAVLNGPVRQGNAMLAAMAAVLRAMRSGRAGHARSDDEDALFI